MTIEIVQTPVKRHPVRVVWIPTVMLCILIGLIPLTAPTIQKAVLRHIIDRGIQYKDQRLLDARIGPSNRLAASTAPAVEVKRFAVPVPPPVPAAASPSIAAAARPDSQPQPGTDGRLPFTVQISSGRSYGKAMALARNLCQKGAPAFTYRHQQPGKGLWSRVCVGAYADRQTAARAVTQWRTRFPSAFVTPSPHWPLEDAPSPKLAESSPAASAPVPAPAPRAGDAAAIDFQKIWTGELGKFKSGPTVPARRFDTAANTTAHGSSRDL